MPYVVNGIGTWYYGKRRVHRLKGTCEFCNRIGELVSYDTTLYVVVFMVPVCPLSHKRIIEQCPSCTQHRVLSLKKWEQGKEKDISEFMEKLAENPNDRETVLRGIALAIGYQDGVLFDKLAAALGEHHTNDAGIQAQLGFGYSYFTRWPEAEAAFRNSLKVENSEAIRRELALTLMKQFRAEEAEPYLRPILENKEQDNAGMIFYLVEAYQAQGQHRDALRVMDQRDAAFPLLSHLSEYQKQRKTSERHQHSGKKMFSAYLSESKNVGYKEKSGASWLPRLIPPIILFGLLAWYLGAAIWIGQSRKVYLVNGAGKPYTVLINGKDYALDPGIARPIELAEGDIQLEFPDPTLGLPPATCRIETSFFSRPFSKPTFVINPDQLAVLAWQQTEYAENPRPTVAEPRYHTGAVLHSFEKLNYEFAPFPHTIKAERGKPITKTRVDLVQNLRSTTRIGLVGEALSGPQQIEYFKRFARVQPNDVVSLGFLAQKLKPAEMLEFLKPGLAVRPIQVEWHRVYQGFTEKLDRNMDLRPEYQKLVAETNSHADAVYLLARLEDFDQADKLLRQAANAKPPAMYALYALGFDAMAQANYPTAVDWLEKAGTLAPDHLLVKRDYWSALFAAKQYDRLVDLLQPNPFDAEEMFSQWIMKVKAYAAKGDKAKAQEAITQALQSLPGEEATQALVRASLEMQICCVENDVAGFLQRGGQVPGANPRFVPTLLKGDLQEAASMIVDDQPQASGHFGLLYLASKKAGNQKLADEAWQKLLKSLDQATRHPRLLGDILAGRQPLNVEVIRKLPIVAEEKRILVAVVAKRFPEKSAELLPFARALDFHKDPTSLCLGKILE